MSVFKIFEVPYLFTYLGIEVHHVILNFSTFFVCVLFLF